MGQFWELVQVQLDSGKTSLCKDMPRMLGAFPAGICVKSRGIALCAFGLRVLGRGGGGWVAPS